MPTIVLIENDIWRELKRRVKPKGIEGGDLPCSVYLEVDSKSFDAVNKDPLLQAKITEAASEHYSRFIAVMAGTLKKHDVAYVKSKSKKERAKILESINNKFESNSKVFVKNAIRAADAAWADVKKTKQEYKTYLIKAGVGLAIEGITLVGGLVSTAGAAATGGFALIAAVYGTIKTLVTIVMKLYKLQIDANKMQKRILKGLTKVQKNYDKGKKNLAGAKDTKQATLNSLLGGDFFPSLTSVKADNEQYKSKIQGVDVNAHAVSKKLNQVLGELDRITKTPEVIASKNLKRMLANLQRAVGNLIDQIINMQGQVVKGKAFHMQTSRAIAEIESKEPKKWKYIQKGLPLVGIVLAGGDFAKAGEAVLAVATATITEVDKALLDAI